MKQSCFISFFSSLALALTPVAIVVSFSTQMASAQESSELRIMSYNVRNGRGLDDKTDHARIADVINKEAPDVVAIQELDKKTKRSNGLDVLEELGKFTNMTASFGAAIDYQGGQYGVGVLSKEEPLKVERFPLPGKEEKRCLLLVEFRDFVFFCSHWSLTKADRVASVAIIANKMKEQRKPVFLCGDFNAQPNEESIRDLQRDWTIISADKLTFPANAPSIRIDYICVADPTGKHATEKLSKAVVNARVVDEPVASDHCPIALEFDMNIFK